MKRASSFVTLVLVMSAGAAVGSAETIPGAIDAELFAGDARLAYRCRAASASRRRSFRRRAV